MYNKMLINDFISTNIYSMCLNLNFSKVWLEFLQESIKHQTQTDFYHETSTFMDYGMILSWTKSDLNFGRTTKT